MSFNIAALLPDVTEKTGNTKLEDSIDGQRGLSRLVVNARVAKSRQRYRYSKCFLSISQIRLNICVQISVLD